MCLCESVGEPHEEVGVCDAQVPVGFLGDAWVEEQRGAAVVAGGGALLARGATAGHRQVLHNCNMTNNICKLQ